MTLGLILGSLTGVSAKEINIRPHLDPGSQAKVNSVIASGQSKRNTNPESFGRITNDGCSDLIIGDFSDSKRPPREVIIVARDIINVNRNC
jgi:hypothetical protein